MMQLTRDQLLGAIVPEFKQVDVPELGGHVYVRTMALGELFGINTSDNSQAAVSLIVAGVCDHEGKALFTRDDAEALSKVQAKVAKRLAEAVSDLNRLGGDDVRDTAKN
jgi:hypothetical protein